MPGTSRYKTLLQFNGKLYEQNAGGLLPENADPSGVNLYRIGTVNPAIKSALQDPPTANCKVGFSVPISTTDVRLNYAKIATATKKYSNPSHHTSSSVTSRNRVQRLKYNTILAGQKANKNYNCVILD